MTGEFYAENEVASSNIFKEAYEKKRPVSDFFAFQNFVIPKNIDEAFERGKANFGNFLFYYLALLGMFNLFVVFSHRIILIPILISGCIYYASVNKLTYRDVQIKPPYAIYGIIGVNLILILFFSKIAYAYVYVVAFSAISGVFIALHASLSLVSEDTPVENI